MAKVDPNARVHPESKYFKWYEVWKSSTAERLDIDNTSEDEQIQANARELVGNILHPLRERFGPIKPNSWYRGEELERMITKKGFAAWCKRKKKNKNEESWQEYFARKSHPKGEACDIEIAGISNDDLFEYIKENLEFDQLIREFPVEGVPDSGWVHVSWAGTKVNRNQAFTIGAK